MPVGSAADERRDLDVPMSATQPPVGATPSAASDDVVARWWTARFAQEPPPLELPLDHPRPRERRADIGRVESSIAPALLHVLRYGASPSLDETLLAAFVALLHRLAHVDDLVVGVRAAFNASRAEAAPDDARADVVPLRLLPRPEQSFDELRHDVHTTWRDALAHQPMDLHRLLTLVPVTHDAARPPLASVCFAHTRAQAASALNGHDGPRADAPFDLELEASEYDDALTLALRFDRTIISEATASRWLAHLEVLLTDVAADAQRTLGRLSLLTDRDRAWIAALERGPIEPVDETRLIHHRVAEIAQAMPDAIAVSSMTETRCYAELDARANRIARYLRRVGVRCDVPVGVLLPREVRLPEAMLGVLRAGGGYMPIDPDLPLARLHFLVRDAGLQHIVTSRAVRALLPDGVAVHVLDLDEHDEVLSGLDGAALPPSPDDATPESTAFVIYTSGSTGIPKGCRNTHRGLLNFSCSNGGESGPSAGTIVMALAASGFDASVGELAMGLSLGAHLVIVPRDIATDGRRLAQAMEEKQARLFFGSPASFQLLIEAGWRGHPEMAVVSGGETLTREMAAALSERAGRVWNVYGPTECAVWVTRSLVSPPPPRVTIGRPMMNARFAVLDAYGERVPVGVAGELFIGGPNVGSGYINRDELTAARFVPDPEATIANAVRYRTGDLVRWLPSGELEFIGRNDDQVKLRGFRIELGEIASRLEELPEVAVAVALVRPIGEGDNRLIAWVQRTPGQTPDETTMRRHLAANLPAYMVPQAFVVMDAFPLLTTGKIDRRALPAPGDVSSASERAYIAPTSPLEMLLADTWARALRLSRVSIDDNFFDLGGHSLIASQILATLRSEHALEVPYRLFFEAPTVQQLALAITAGNYQSSPSSALHLSRRAERDAEPASIIQQRLHLLESLDPARREALVHSAAWHLHGALDAACLEQALHAIIARHDILRTRFEVRDGALQQFVTAEVPFTLQRFDATRLPTLERDATIADTIAAFRAAPFDLSAPPLFRAMLVQVQEDQHLLVIGQHGLVWDGASFDVFLDDLDTAYSDLLRGALPSWTALPIRYADFSAWQQEQIASEAMAHHVTWWRTHLGTNRPVLDIPGDRARSASPSFAGRRVEHVLEARSADTLRRVAQQQGATLFQFLFTAFHALLHRYTEQESVIVATPMRNRTRSEFARLIGPFTNTVALRSHVHGDLPFVEALRTIRADCIHAVEHEQVPMELLGRDAPEVRALFSMQDLRDRRRTLGDCRLDDHALPTHTATNDLMLSVVESSDALRLSLVYRTELFDHDTATTMLSQYVSVVRSAAESPEAPLARLAMSAAESRDAQPPAEGAAATQVRTVPVASSRHAVTWSRRRTLTPAALGQQVRAVATALQAQAPTTCLIARLRDDAARVVLQLAAAHAGRAVVFLHPDDSDQYLQRVADGVGGGALVITERPIRECSRNTPYAALVRDIDETDTVTECSIHTADSAMVEATAETVHLLWHRAPALADAVTAMRDVMAVAPDECVLDLASSEHDGPPLVALAALSVRAARCGHDELADAEPDELIAHIREVRPDVLVVTAEQVRALHDGRWAGETALRVVVRGPLCESLSRWLGSVVGRAVSTVAIPELLGPIAIGMLPCPPMVRVLPSVAARVVDARGNDAPAGVRGHLVLDGADGASLLTAHPARRKASGDRFVEVPGLSTPWIAGAARRFGELSFVLQGVAAAREAAYGHLTDAAGRRRLVGILAGAPEADVAELRRRLRALVPSWAVPAAFVRVDTLPRNADGTLDLQAIPRPWPEATGMSPRRRPESSSERLIAGIWQELLGINDVHAADNFFARGGHSLLALRCLEQLRVHTGIRLEPRTLLFGTLERLATTLDEALAVAAGAAS
ncbi:MAG: amino acid adenylation domain-containing protein [Gemmatimonadaceae bacterium]|nr:amino acid adenylation domain-containing protein [Gemmatimonadaceae bacterium]